MSAPSNQKAFTLVELLVVISIIAILSVIGITIFSSTQKAARDAKRRSDLKAITNALEQFKAVNGNYPQVANTGGPWFCEGYEQVNFSENPQIIAALSPYFTGGIPKDPVNNSTYEYKLDMIKDKNLYWLYATLENPPQARPLIYGWQSGKSDSNACYGGNLPVDLLIQNQQ